MLSPTPLEVAPEVQTGSFLLVTFLLDKQKKSDIPARHINFLIYEDCAYALFSVILQPDTNRNIQNIEMNRFRIVCALCATLSVAGTLKAEEKDTLKVVDVEEITVIAAPKENRKLRELPHAVSLLSQQAMQAAQVTTIKDMTAIVPNLFIPDYGSRLTTAVYIRGIGSRINTPSVGLYVDNIPYINQAAFDFSYADVERIDVLRGPQSTLYGRNAMGGLIKVHTKSPFSYQGTDVRLGAATHGSYDASLTHYHRVSSRFAFSTGGFYTYDDGFFRNKALGNKKVDRGQSAGGRLRAVCLPADNWKVDLNVSYEYSDQSGYPYQYMGSKAGAADESVGEVAYNRESSYRRNLLNSGLNVEYRGRGFTLSAVTGHQWVDDRMFLDQDFTAADIYTLEQRQRIHTLSEEVVLKSATKGRWQWTTGAFGFYQWLKTDAPVIFRPDGMAMLGRMLGGVIPSQIEVSMGPAGSMNILPSLTIDDRELLIAGGFRTPQLNGALFHQSTFDRLLGLDGLSLTVGVRLDYEKQKLTYDSGCGLNYSVGIRGQMLRGGQPVRDIEMMPSTSLCVESRYQGGLDKDYLQLLPKAALQYALPAGRGNLYVSVSKGYRSGGYNIQKFSELLQSSLRNDMMRQTREAVLTHVPEQYASFVEQYFPQAGENPEARAAVEYKPEQTWNYELGAHLNLWNRRVQLDAALFWLETKDQQISRFVQSGLGRETVNAGKSRSLGGECALAAALTDEWTLNAAYGYTYATFRDYYVGAQSDAAEAIDYTGNYVPFVPKHTFNVGMQYAWPLRGRALLDRIVFSADYRAAGRIYWTEDNTASQSLYGTLNGRISFRKGGGQIDLWVRNALDRKYDAFYFESMGNCFRQLGRPVQAGIEVRCRF